VEVLLYPSNVDARRVMDEALSSAPVRPSAEMMKQEVSSALNAFGTLPSRAVDETVKVIPIQNGAETLKITRPPAARHQRRRSTAPDPSVSHLPAGGYYALSSRHLHRSFLCCRAYAVSR